jgi:hypothetical protein
MCKWRIEYGTCSEPKREKYEKIRKMSVPDREDSKYKGPVAESSLLHSGDRATENRASIYGAL